MKKILIVENNDENAELLMSFFGTTYKVRLATNSAAAQKILRNTAIDLVITANFGAGGTNAGAQLTCWIKEHFPQIRIVLTSGLNEPAGHRADAFVKKPFLIERLALAVAELLGA